MASDAVLHERCNVVVATGGEEDYPTFGTAPFLFDNHERSRLIAGQLLTIKLYIPHTRSELVTRPRLMEQLNDGLHRKLIFISVPARINKTTLVGEWISNIRKDHEKGDQTDRIAWLCLKGGDYAPARLPAYVIAALNRVQ